MTSKNAAERMCNCPVGTFIKDVERAFGKKSSFIDHMTQSRIEVLKGIRSLVDERVNSLEKELSGGGKKKATKIKVE
jgi:hypothetical protein